MYVCVLMYAFLFFSVDESDDENEFDEDDEDENFDPYMKDLEGAKY